MNATTKTMTKEQAYKELAKVAITLKALECGAVSLMSDEQVNKLMEWLK